MSIMLTFSTSQTNSGKVAKFPSVELKVAYVAAENTDYNCRQAYYNHQAAKTKAARKVTAETLDGVRYAFYSRWAKKHTPNQKFPPLKPVDGGYTA